MKNAEFSVGSKIRVVNKDSCYYKYRGRISSEELIGGNHVGWCCILHDESGSQTSAILNDDEIVNIQKKFIDIEHIRETDEVLGKDAEGDDIIRKSNTHAFEIGDLIVIQQKIDGANASISYNKEDEKLEVFSRTNLLDGVDGLRGFKQFIETKLDPAEYAASPEYVIFGEWLVPHKCLYEKDYYSKWYVYDIWDKNLKNYKSQELVREFCHKHGLIYVEPLYAGPFISWEHCRSFMSKNPFGKQQEGVVVKNQSKLERDDIRSPKYLKIVNDAFKESVRIKAKKEIDPEVKKEMDRSRELIASVVTEARVNKHILKLIDVGVLPRELTPRCMGTVMKNLPKLIWEDILKEEREVVLAAGEYASKFCSGIVGELARKLVIGK